MLHWVNMKCMTTRPNKIWSRHNFFWCSLWHLFTLLLDWNSLTIWGLTDQMWCKVYYTEDGSVNNSSVNDGSVIDASLRWWLQCKRRRYKRPYSFYNAVVLCCPHPYHRSPFLSFQSHCRAVKCIKFYAPDFLQ